MCVAMGVLLPVLRAPGVRNVGTCGLRCCRYLISAVETSTRIGSSYIRVPDAPSEETEECVSLSVCETVPYIASTGLGYPLRVQLYCKYSIKITLTFLEVNIDD